MTAVMDERTTERAPARARANWRPLLRLGARDARRRKGRTALVVLLVALPVALMIVAAVVLQSADMSRRDIELLALGHTADVLLYPSSDTVEPLPSTWQQTTVANVGYLRVKANGRFRFTSVLQGSLDSPLLAGAYVVTGGVAPTAPDTAAVSTEFARHYGVRRGDTIAMRDGQSFRVVGTYERADAVRDESVLLPVRPAVVRPGVGVFGPIYVKVPSVAALESFLAGPGGRGYEIGVVRQIPENRPPDYQSYVGQDLMPTVILYTLGTTGLFLVGIVISAAFAVSARRQLRTLGLLSANGATPAVLGRAMAAQGVVTGVAGTVVGFGLGAAGLAALAPHLNRLIGRRLPGLVVPPAQLVAIAVMGVATAAIAAWLPGRAVARVPTLAALGGRRPVEPVKAHVPAIGVVLFAGGLALLGVTSAAGNMSNQLARWAQFVGAIGGMMVGGVLCMPWIVGHGEALARRWKGGRRLAARSLARNRSRSGPIAAAILVTAGAAMVAATFDESNHDQVERYRQRVEPRSVMVQSFDESSNLGNVVPPEDALALVREVLPSATEVHFHQLSFDGTPALRGAPGDGTGMFLSMDDRSLRRLAGDAAADAHAAGSAVVLEPASLVENGAITLDLQPNPVDEGTPSETTASSAPPAGTPSISVRVPAVAAARPVSIWDCQGDCPPPNELPVIVLPERVAMANGFQTAPGPIVQFRVDRLLSAGERQKLRELNTVFAEEAQGTAERSGDAVRTQIDMTDVSGERNRNLQLILTSIVLVLALGVAGIGLALTSTENRADDATLLALGAPPRFRRRVRFWEALLLTAAGALPAVPLGYAIGAVAISGGTDGHPLPFPWRTGLVLGIALPLVAAGLFWLFARTPRIVLVRED